MLLEWHPQLCKLAGTEPQLAFAALRVGCDHCVFFTKCGWFSHFGDERVDQLKSLCLIGRSLPDGHYEVVTLHPSSTTRLLSPTSALGKFELPGASRLRSL